jgi:hypothetical protein
MPWHVAAAVEEAEAATVAAVVAAANQPTLAAAVVRMIPGLHPVRGVVTTPQGTPAAVARTMPSAMCAVRTTPLEQFAEAVARTMPWATCAVQMM